MKHRIRKLLSVLLALVTAASLLPVSALADGGLTVTVTNQEELTTVLKEDITVTGDDVQTMGKIIVPEGFRLTVADGAYLEAGIDNYGSIEVESGGSLATAMGGNITNNGALTVKKGGVLRSQKGGSVVNGGTMVLNGEFYCGVLHKTEEDPDTIYFRNRGRVTGSGSVIPYQMTPAIPVDMKAAAEALRGMLPDTITVAADPATTACDAVVSAPAGTVVEASGGEQSIGTVSVSDAKNAEQLYLGVRYTMLASGENRIGITVIGRNRITDTDHVFDHPGTGEAEGDTYPIIYSSGDSAQTAAKRPMDMFVRIDAAQLASAPDGIYTALLVYDIRSDTAAVPKNMTQTLTLEKIGAAAYPIWVGSTQVTEANRSDILDDGGRAKYSPATRTLTLSDLTITGAYNDMCIYAYGTDTLTITGSAYVTGSEYGIYKDGGTLRIAGSGTNLTASGGVNGITVRDGNIIIEGAEVTATGADRGIAAVRDISATPPSGSGSITLTNAVVDVTGLRFALSTYGDLTVTDSDLTAVVLPINDGAGFGIVTEKLNVSGDSRIEARIEAAPSLIRPIVDFTELNLGAGLAIVQPVGVREFHRGLGHYTFAEADGTTFATRVVIGKASTYAVAVEPARLTLTAEEGYGEGDVYRDIEVTSIGADKIDFVMAGAWDISAYEILSVTSSGMSVRVCARAGLKAGVYTAAVMIHDTENRFEPVRVPVTFTVTAKSSGGGGGSGSGGGGETAAQYTLTYKTNGGSAIAPTEHDGGTTVTLTAAPAREGHTFTGWYSDAKLTNRITSVVMDGDKTVYAGWKENEASAPSDAFADVPAGAWYREAVDYVAERGLMNGTSADRFSPNVTTTRAMIVTTLYRLAGEPAANGKTVFDDVAADSWYAKAVAWAAANGIAMGYGDGRFGPDDRITREQFAAIMYRYASLKGYDTSVGQDTNILSYDDAFAVSRWAMEAMQWACGAGLISGRTATTLAPGGEATRAEAAAILMRFVENVK